MSSGILLALDLSTTMTGYSCFNISTKKLAKFGTLKPIVKNAHKMRYPEAAYYRIKDMSVKVRDLVKDKDPDIIVIEEVNRGISRIGQKTLDGLHFFVLDLLIQLDPKLAKKIVYVDSNGKKGWRGYLGLKLSTSDKENNKKARGSKKKKANKNLHVVDWKVLAERYVNTCFSLKFDVIKNPGDNDIVDSIALGHAYLTKILK